MTCGRDDPPGYTCAGGYPKGAPGCGQHFGSLDTFDKHFIKTPKVDAEGFTVTRCATPREMERKGYHLSSNGVWKRPMDEERVKSLRHPSVTLRDRLRTDGVVA
jgi:hypothetical protein